MGDSRVRTALALSNSRSRSSRSRAPNDKLARPTRTLTFNGQCEHAGEQASLLYALCPCLDSVASWDDKIHHHQSQIRHNILIFHMYCILIDEAVFYCETISISAKAVVADHHCRPRRRRRRRRTSLAGAVGGSRSVCLCDLLFVTKVSTISSVLLFVGLVHRACQLKWPDRSRKRGQNVPESALTAITTHCLCVQLPISSVSAKLERAREAQQ